MSKREKEKKEKEREKRRERKMERGEEIRRDKTNLLIISPL
jgi:hypothetical protein